MQSRINGFDLARALALFGMVFVNFRLLMNASEGSSGLLWFATFMEGKAVAIFIVLAGVGLTLMYKRAKEKNPTTTIQNVRATLFVRAILLIGIGFLLTPFWNADILHFYGFYFIVGVFLLHVSDEELWVAIVTFTTLFVVLLSLFNYESGWDFETLTYIDLWSIEGMIRHLFFNGFHPIFPWTAFLLFGMWLGRQALHTHKVRKRLLSMALIMYVLVTLLSQLLNSAIVRELLEISLEDATAIFGTSPIPPLPLYLLASGSMATVVIVVSLWISEKSQSPLLNPLYAVGKLSLTLYVLHIFVGTGLLEVLPVLEEQPIEVAVLSATLFCMVSIFCAHVLLRNYRMGPLEWVMKKSPTKLKHFIKVT
jgi:uncharacterized membrane protein YeiB